MKMLLCVFMLLFNELVWGQREDRGCFVLKGRVVDGESGEALAYATVAIIKFPMIEKILKGGVTDGKGRFELKVLKSECRLVVRCLGYRNFVKSLEPDMEDAIDLGIIRMTVQAEQLDMVTVKPLVEVSVDEIKYDLTRDPDRETASLHEILQKVPLVHLSPMGDIYVDAPDKKFLVVRNGKVDALFSGSLNDILKTLPAKGFASVTVQLAPPERYGEYDYILNIESDKNARLFGMIGMTEGRLDLNIGETKGQESLVASLDNAVYVGRGICQHPYSRVNTIDGATAGVNPTPTGAAERGFGGTMDCGR